MEVVTASRSVYHSWNSMRRVIGLVEARVLAMRLDDSENLSRFDMT